MQQAADLVRLQDSPRATPSATNGSAGRGSVSHEGVELLFRTFARRFGYRWRQQFEDLKARSLWMRDLRAAGLGDADLRFGLERSAELKWPPSTGEFIELCKPSLEAFGLPAFEDAYLEAWRACGRPGHKWSHPAVGHAAAAVTWRADFGGFRSHGDMRAQFRYHYDLLCRRVLQGEDLDAPMPQPLPERVHQRTPEASRKGIERLRAALGGDDADGS